MSLDYNEALDYLYSLINYEVTRPERYTPEVVSLERPRALMAALGNPQDSYPTIHVTGTKGKGSVSAMCASVLQAAGLRVGLYSSPHLQDFRERFRINGELIDTAVMASLVERIQPLVKQIPGLTWFEVTTAIGFLYFAQAEVDVAIFEVGLGGRLDATNILRAPLVTTITSLSYDHMQLLGNTLAEIAFEKAGIIKSGIPTVSAPQLDEPLEVLERIAADRGAPLTLVGRDYTFEPQDQDENGQWFTVSAQDGVAHRYWTPLLGRHQVLNATVALATLHHACVANPKIGAAVTQQTIRSGLAQVNWPGRLEVVRRAPWLVLDVAHNGASAEKLAAALVSIFHYEKLILIFGAFTDKDVLGMFNALLPITSHLILMQAINPRAFTTEQLAEIVSKSGYTGSLDLIPDAQEALARAEALAGPRDLTCVTGSLSIVGEVRTILGLAPARAAYLDEVDVQVLQSMT
ncbi:MAG: folylpolyglutamate synthase/dihydrofolate synthase family protein [Chloroflexota bacterium]